MKSYLKGKEITSWALVLILTFSSMLVPWKNVNADATSLATPPTTVNSSTYDAVYGGNVTPSTTVTTGTYNEIVNGGFETGDLTGWTVTDGSAFGPNSVSSATTWWNEKIPYNQDGTYHLDGWAYPESATGTLRSSTFNLQGSGWITFKLGGGKNTDLCNIQVFDADTNQMIAKYGNTEFADKNFPHIDQGMNLANMVQYRADLSKFLGKNLYIDIVDNATSDWGVMFADSFTAYNPTVPAQGIIAIDLSQPITDNILNPDFETGDFTGWTVTGNAFGVSDVTTYWQTHLFNQHGKYHVWGFVDPANGGAGDDGKGVLKSSIFKLGGNGTINFLVGGGKDTSSDMSNLYVALVSAKDGRELIKATGNNDEGYTRIVWDATAYIGQYLYIKVVDNIGGGFGHINVDDFNVYNQDAPLSDDIINPDFATGDLTGWTTASGDAFQVRNTVSQATYQLCDNDISKVGVLNSSEFSLGGTGKINMLLSGGSDINNLYVALVDAANNTELLKVTNPQNSDTYQRVEMDASKYIGKKVYLKIVDNSTENFGYINVEDIHVKNFGAVASWNFDEAKGTSAKDCVSGTNDYINYVFNTAKYKPVTDPEWRKGIENSGLLFDGYSTWISRVADKFTKPSNAITISAWIAPRTYEYGDSGQMSIIANQEDKSKAQGFGFGIGRHGTWSLQLGVGGAWFEVWADNDKPIPLDKWSYVVATYDMDSQYMKLYLNGQLAGQSKVPVRAFITPANEPLLIGKHNQPAIINGIFSANMFDGLIDELNISYAPTTDQQVKDSYDKYLSNFGGTVPTPDLNLDRSVYNGDMYRPQYHLIPAEHWMNEPHAPIYYKGLYHIFYQANPRAPYWHYINWGHMVSADMIHWKDEPIALMPLPNSVAPDGVWSGSATYDKDGKPVLFFTAGNDSATPNQSIAIATATDYSNPELPTWKMNDSLTTVQAQNLAGQNPGETALVGQFRDPFVFKDGDTWYQLVGSGISKTVNNDVYTVGGAELAYTSKDMVNWTYKGPFLEGNYNKYHISGYDWELPVFLPLNDINGKATGKYIMLVSPCYNNTQETIKYQSKTVLYWIGTFDKENCRFLPDQEEPQSFDYGQHFSGPSGFIDQKGRTIIFSITQDSRSEQEHYDAGWAHNGGLPVQLSYDNGKLGVNPITDELNTLHDKQLVNFTDKSSPEANAILKDIKGDMLDIQLDIDPKDAKKFGINVRRSPDGQEETTLDYDVNSKTFNVDGSKTSLNPDTQKGITGGPLELDGQDLKLHIYLDRSMIEAYANGIRSITTRAYPVRYDSLGLQIFGNVNIKSMVVWSMKSAYGDGTVVPVYTVPQDTLNKYGNITNGGFETGDLTGWTVEGNAFSNDMVTNSADWGWGGPFNQAQKPDGTPGYHLWGFKAPEKGGLGDAATGSIKSNTFQLAGNGQISFLIGGGNDIGNLYVALVNAKDNSILFKATGNNVETYSRVNWDASRYVGNDVYIEVVDNSTAGFGHINVDDFHAPATLETKVITNIPEVDAVSNQGDNYTLPLKVEAIMNDGSKENVRVNWETSSVDTADTGLKLYTGIVDGYEGEAALLLNVQQKQYVPTTPTTSPTVIPTATVMPTDDNVNQVHKDADQKADTILSKIGNKVDPKTAADLLNQVVTNCQDISLEKAKEVINLVIDKVDKVDASVIEKIQQIMSNAGKIDTVQIQSNSEGKTVVQVDSKLIDSAIDNFSNILNGIVQKVSAKNDDIKLADSLKENAKITLTINDNGGAADIKLPAESIKKLQNAGLIMQLNTSDTQLTFSPKAIDLSSFPNIQSVTISKQTMSPGQSNDLAQKVVTLDKDMKPIGNVYSFALTVTDNNNQTQLHNFNDFIQISLRLNNNDLKDITDRRKAGIYYVKDDGTYEYVGGQITSTGVSFAINHFSNYTIMQYNKTFNDIKNSWAKDNIEVLAAKHIITGTDKAQNLFNPTGKVTRAQLVTLIARALGLKAKSENQAFSDVPSNMWYAESVEAAKEAGIISGDAKGKFNPDELVTREEMAKIIVTAYEYQSGRKTAEIAAKFTGSFKDMGKVSPWAVDYVKSAKVLNFISGMNNGNYNPKDSVQRDQAAKVIYAMLAKAQLL